METTTGITGWVSSVHLGYFFFRWKVTHSKNPACSPVQNNENCWVQSLSHQGLTGLSLSKTVLYRLKATPCSWVLQAKIFCQIKGLKLCLCGRWHGPQHRQRKYAKSLHCLNPEGIIWAKDFSYNWQCKHPADGSHFTDVALSLVTLTVGKSCQMTHICR